MVIDAAAGVEMLELAALDLITELELSALGEVKKRREDPRYKALFPAGLTALKALDSREFRTKELDRMIGQLKVQPADSASRRFLKPLEEVAQELKGPAKLLEESELKQSLAHTALVGAKTEWLDSYVSLHGALEEAFPRQRAFVEAFFPKSKPAPKKVATPAMKVA